MPNFGILPDSLRQLCVRRHLLPLSLLHLNKIFIANNWTDITHNRKIHGNPAGPCGISPAPEVNIAQLRRTLCSNYSSTKLLPRFFLDHLRFRPHLPQNARCGAVRCLLPGKAEFLQMAEFTTAVMASVYEGPWKCSMGKTSVVGTHGRRGISGLASLWYEIEREACFVPALY